MSTAVAVSHDSAQLVVFSVLDEDYALPISYVQEIVRYTEPRPMPESPPGMQGIVNLRGRVVPIMSMRTAFGHPRVEPDESWSIMILDLGERRVGIVVDQVREVITVPGEAIETPPTGVAATAGAVAAVVKLDERLVILFDPTTLTDAHSGSLTVARRATLDTPVPDEGEALAADDAGPPEADAEPGPAITHRQAALVRETFDMVAPQAEMVAETFYTRLFEIDPSLRDLFTSDMAEQGRKLMSTIKLAVHSLDRLEDIVPAVQKLGARHRDYGVLDAHYGTVAQALLWTLEQGLGSRFDAETREAWVAVYTTLASVMTGAPQD